MIKRNSIPHYFLKEMINIPYVNYENCPICDSELTDIKLGFSGIGKKCRNKCYRFYIHSLDKKKEVYLPFIIRIFGKGFNFTTNIGISPDCRHYFHDYSYFLMIEKKVENLIKHYKSNDRYLMKILTEVK